MESHLGGSVGHTVPAAAAAQEYTRADTERSRDGVALGNRNGVHMASVQA